MSGAHDLVMAARKYALFAFSVRVYGWVCLCVGVCVCNMWCMLQCCIHIEGILVRGGEVVSHGIEGYDSKLYSIIFWSSF